MELQARIFDVQKFSLQDGPGIRTTVFFKGCNLCCAWCHNPEGMERQIQHDTAGTTCYGYDITQSELLREVLTDAAFYRSSGGGVTCSGGECMLQAEFLSAFLHDCKAAGIHTTIDTAGNVPWSSFEQVLPTADLFLYDLKAGSEALHRQYTGVSNGQIWENLTRLLWADKQVWIRIPVIGAVNSNPEEMEQIACYLERIGFHQRIDLFAYHTYGRKKYEMLYGREQALFSAPSRADLERWGERMSHFSPDVHLTP